MKRPIIAWIIGSLAAVLLIFAHLFHSDRDAEVALGLKHLPWSAHNILISTDAWTDYVVRGYIEVSTEDFDLITHSRVYERMEHPAHKLSEEPLLSRKTLTSTTSYYWHQGDSHCEIMCDSTHSWIWFIYSTD